VTVDLGEHGAVEVRRVGRPAAGGRTSLVMLHEGLGSVSAWRDVPEALAEALDIEVIVYSRPGYGWSTPRAPGEAWLPDFMHRQAYEVLPALLAALDVERPLLFGHSDGASIALLHAARHPVAGVAAMAPHVFVEPVTRTSIRAARVAYEAGGLRERLARHHADVDSAFYGWNDAWLRPAFAEWTIDADIAPSAAPTLILQGRDDEYGTLAQVDRIVARLPQAEVRIFERCGHSPHRDQRAAVLAATAEWWARCGDGRRG